VADQLPRQGETHPWHNRQDYYHDTKTLLEDPVDEAGLVFEPAKAEEAKPKPKLKAVA